MIKQSLETREVHGSSATTDVLDTLLNISEDNNNEIDRILIIHLILLSTSTLLHHSILLNMVCHSENSYRIYLLQVRNNVEHIRMGNDSYYTIQRN